MIIKNWLKGLELLGVIKVIEGLLLTRAEKIINEKGDIYHAIKAESIGFKGFGEAYFSKIKKGVIKGWKRHNRVTLNLLVPIGEIIFVIYDDRSNSSSNGSFYETRLSPENYFRLTVPPGVWVAFKGMKDNNMLLNIIPDEHDPFESDNLPLDGINYSW
jgi:dTDP-4-dehydrorhamnose 3,5-epimerase